MKLQFVLLTFIVLTSCSNPKAIQDQTKIIDQVGRETEPLLDAPEDTLSYIGFIDKFEDNNTFYTDLYFKDDFNYELYDKITQMDGDVVFKEDDITRTKFEIDKVGQYFNLTGLQNIDVYNIKNEKLTTGELSHIEYFEDVIEGRFVAVFRVKDPNISDHLFGIGNTNRELAKIEFASYDDESLNSDLIDFLKVDSDDIWRIKHYKLDNETIYSTVSADTTAYVIETLDGNHTALYKSKSSEVINALFAVSGKISRRPILITKSGMPETDMTWTSVLIFNGKGYEVSSDHRISRQ